MLNEINSDIAKFRGHYKELTFPGSCPPEDLYLLSDKIAETEDLLDLCVPMRRLSITMIDDPIFRLQVLPDLATKDIASDCLTYMVGLAVADMSGKESLVANRTFQSKSSILKLKTSMKVVTLWEKLSKIVGENYKGLVSTIPLEITSNRVGYPKYALVPFNFDG